jgi:hypothetical protein
MESLLASPSFHKPSPDTQQKAQGLVARILSLSWYFDPKDPVGDKCDFF